MVKHLAGSLRDTCRITLPRVSTNTLAQQKPQLGEKGQTGCFARFQEAKGVLLVLQDGSLHEIPKAG